MSAADDVEDVDVSVGEALQAVQVGRRRRRIEQESSKMMRENKESGCNVLVILTFSMSHFFTSSVFVGWLIATVGRPL